MTLSRFHDWPSRLIAAIESRRNEPFKWGTQDCCMFAADIVMAITGGDIAAKWRVTYTDAIGAALAIKRGGGIDGLVAGVADDFGLRALPSVAYAQRGDLVEIDIENTGDSAGPALGVCVGSMVAGAGADGVVFVPLLKCRKAWRVG